MLRLDSVSGVSPGPSDICLHLTDFIRSVQDICLGHVYTWISEFQSEHFALH